MTAEDFEAMGYFNPVEIGGVWMAGMTFAFTHGLVIGLDDTGYEYRYCYENYHDVVHALRNWHGVGHPPGPWIKRKGLVPEILGPGAHD